MDFKRTLIVFAMVMFYTTLAFGYPFSPVTTLDFPVSPTATIDTTQTFNVSLFIQADNATTLYDDFEDSSIDSSKWSTAVTGGGSVTEGSGILQALAGGNSNPSSAQATSIGLPPIADLDAIILTGRVSSNAAAYNDEAYVRFGGEDLDTIDTIGGSTKYYLVTRINSSTFNVYRGNTIPMQTLYKTIVPTTSNLSIFSSHTGTFPSGPSVNTWMEYVYYENTTTFELANSTLYLWNSSGFTNTSFNTVTGTVNETNWTLGSLARDTYEWNAYTCIQNGTDTECSFSASNNTLIISQFQVNDLDYVGDGLYETENSTYILNLTTNEGAELFSSTLNYDGTSYLVDTIENMSTSNYMLTYNLDLPNVDVNTSKNFTFTVTLNLGAGFQSQNTSNYFQNVSLANITNDGSLSATYNFYDEETLQPIFVNIGETIDWYLGSGNVTDNSTFSDYNNTAQRKIFPSKDFANNAKIRLENSSYTTRNFYMVDDFTSTARTQDFYLLGENNGTNVIIEVKDQGLGPVEGYIVSIERYYPDTNQYRMVEQQITDAFGQFSARLIEDTVKYRFTFRDSSGTVVETQDNVNIACRSTICILSFIISEDTDDFERFSDIDGYDYTFSFDDSTGEFEFTWNDNREGSFNNRLVVERIAFNRSEIVCSSTDDSSFGSLTCDTGNQTGSYRGQIYTQVNGEYRRIDLLNVKIGDESQTYGIEGLLWAFILLFTLVAVGSFNPPIGIIMYLVGLIGVMVLGIAYISPVILIANFVIGVLFIWAFKG